MQFRQFNIFAELFLDDKEKNGKVITAITFNAPFLPEIRLPCLSAGI